MPNLRKRRYGILARIIDVLFAIAAIFLVLATLWHGLIGAVVGAIVMAILGKNILWGILGGGAIAVILFLFSEDGVFAGNDDVGYAGESYSNSLNKTEALPKTVSLSSTETGRQILIQRPIDQVFQYVATIDHYPDWKSGIAQIEQLSSHNQGVDVQFMQEAAWPGLYQPTTVTITAWDIDRKLAYRCQPQGRTPASYIAGGYYTFTPTSTGTRVAHVVDVKRRWSGDRKRAFRRTVARELVQLKQQLEANQTDKC